MLNGISHLGIAVRDLDAAIDRYQRAFGLSVEHRWLAEADLMQAASFRIGDVTIELMQPTSPDSPVARFLDKRGEGIHHVCFAVDDVAEALGEVRAAGLETVDEEPRPGGDGHTLVAFVHPKSLFGVLTELEQHA